MNEIITKESVDCVSRMAKAFAMSGLFGFKTEADAFALMTIAQANGLHPAKAAERYHIIQGRPAMKSEAMLSSFQESGGKIKWLKRTNTECVLHLEHPQGGELDVKWDIARAKAAGLTDKNTWKQFPAQMLSARCVSEGVRALFPACLCGMYTPEEVTDMDETRQTTPKDTQGQSIDKSNAVEAEVVSESVSAPEKTYDDETATFVKYMDAFKSRNPEAFADTLGANGYESAEDVPAEKRKAVYKAVKAACTATSTATNA